MQHCTVVYTQLVLVQLVQVHLYTTVVYTQVNHDSSSHFNKLIKKQDLRFAILSL